jgi:hypothetical protein
MGLVVLLNAQFALTMEVIAVRLKQLIPISFACGYRVRQLISRRLGSLVQMGEK